jgi:multidrug resistance efflux pump
LETPACWATPSIDVDLAKTRLLAPFDGTVVRRLVDEGRVLGSGEAVVHLQEQRAPQIRIGIAGPGVAGSAWG